MILNENVSPCYQMKARVKMEATPFANIVVPSFFLPDPEIEFFSFSVFDFLLSSGRCQVEFGVLFL